MQIVLNTHHGKRRNTRVIVATTADSKDVIKYLASGRPEKRKEYVSMGRKLSIGHVLQHLDIGRTTLHRLRKNEGFPAPALQIGKLQRWDEDDIEEWVRTTNKKELPR